MPWVILLLSVLTFDYTLSVCNWEYIKCVVQTDASQMHAPDLHILHFLCQQMPTLRYSDFTTCQDRCGKCWKKEELSWTSKKFSFHSSKNILTPLFYGGLVSHWPASAAVLFCYTEWITKRKLFVGVTTLLRKLEKSFLSCFSGAETPPCSKTWKQFIFTNVNSYFDRLCLQCYEHYCWRDIFWLKKEHNFKSLLKEQHLISPKSNKVPQQKNKNNCLIIYSIHLIQYVLWQTKRRGKWGNQKPNKKT